jgi:electron transfer flavoprotein alpha subunit
MSVVLCSWGETVDGGTEETLSLAGRLSRARAVALDWLVIGAMADAAPQIAASHGVAHIDRIGGATPGPDALVALIAGYCAAQQPRVILFNQTAAARLVAPRVAARLGVPVVMNGFYIETQGSELEVRATAYGGDTHAVYRLPEPVNVVSIVSTTLRVEPAPQPGVPVVREVAADGGATTERWTVVSAPRADGPRLEDADIIVSGGRGLGSAANYALVREFAELIGGMHGASRAIVDDGWIDSSRQVGLTGKITRPGLYVAVGISGASQHMAGCSAAKTIVGINKDRDASIFRYARYGIAGDCLEVMPELIKAARAGNN